MRCTEGGAVNVDAFDSNLDRTSDAIKQRRPKSPAELDRPDFSALALHGDHNEALIRFTNRSCNVLVATDVAARGLDIKELPLVVSYDVAHDADTHTHRIGRTGRAGSTELAITFAGSRELNKLRAIDERAGGAIARYPAKPGDGKKVLNLASNKTLVIDAGRKDKLRPGDILGALTGDAGLKAADIGKIDVYATRAYVAIKRDLAGKALARLRKGKIKGRSFRVRPLG